MAASSVRCWQRDVADDTGSAESGDLASSEPLQDLCRRPTRRERAIKRRDPARSAPACRPTRHRRRDLSSDEEALVQRREQFRAVLTLDGPCAATNDVFVKATVVGEPSLRLGRDSGNHPRTLRCTTENRMPGRVSADRYQAPKYAPIGRVAAFLCQWAAMFCVKVPRANRRGRGARSHSCRWRRRESQPVWQSSLHGV